MCGRFSFWPFREAKILQDYQQSLTSLVGQKAKEYACNGGDLGSILGLGRPPGEGNSYPLQYSCLENPHGQRSLMGYSPWGCKELDTTEWQAHQQSLHIVFYANPETAFQKMFSLLRYFPFSSFPGVVREVNNLLLSFKIHSLLIISSHPECFYEWGENLEI